MTGGSPSEKLPDTASLALPKGEPNWRAHAGGVEWHPRQPTVLPSKENPWKDNVEVTIRDKEVKLGITDEGNGAVIFVDAQFEETMTPVWSITYAGQRHLTSTHKHFPRLPSCSLSSLGKDVAVSLIALLPPVKVENSVARWRPEVIGKFYPGEEIRSSSFVLADGKVSVIIFPMGEKNGAHCTYYVRAHRGTRQIFAFSINEKKRCAAHVWDREGNWGFPLFGPAILQKGHLRVSLEACGAIPGVTVEDRIASWVFTHEQVASYQPGEEIRSPTFLLQGIDMNIYFYPRGTRDGDGDHIALFLKSSQAFSAQLCVDRIGPRSLAHDGRGVWGYPCFCAGSLPDSLDFQVEILCQRDFVPRVLTVSRTLCERANLPVPDTPGVGQPAVLWLGGDAGSVNRVLMAWYLAVLGVHTYWHNVEPDESWEPSVRLLAVATGDDELIDAQDRLAHRLNVPVSGGQNDVATTWLRRHKFGQRYGVEPEDDDYVITGASRWQILEAIEQIGGFPVVLKVPLSDSSAGVSIVENALDVQTALRETIWPAAHWDEFRSIECDEMSKHLTYRYAVPRQVVVERLFTGTEYVVNCVSYDGVHCVTDSWLSDQKIPERETKRPLYDTQCLCDIPEDVLQFSLKILDDCGMRYGASHIELIQLPSGRCRLIELNPRLAGDFPRAHDCASSAPGSAFVRKYGANQFSLLALSFVAPEEFKEYCRRTRNRPLPKTEFVTAVYLRAENDCKLVGKGMAEICMLPTFNGMRRGLGHLPVPAAYHPLKLALQPQKAPAASPRFAPRGSSVARTMSLRTCPGVVLLRSADNEAVLRDVNAVRRVEQCGLYDG